MGSLALNEVSWLDGSVALIARGVVDDDTVEHFESRLDSAIGTGSRQLIIDLTACQLASAGLAALMRLQRRSSSRPAATRLVATGVELLRLLRIVGLTSQFPIYATLDAALRSGRSAAPRVAGVNGVAVRPSKQTGLRGAAEVRHLTSIKDFGAARFSRPVERGGRAIGHGSRAAAGCRQ